MTCRRDSIRYRGRASSGSARGGTLPRDLGRLGSSASVATFIIDREQIRADRSREKRRSRWQITARFGDHHVRTRVRRPRGLIERTCRPTRGRTGERRVHHRTHQPWRIRRTNSFDHWSKKAAEGVTLPRNDRTTDQIVFDQWTPTWYPPCCTRELLI